MQCNAMQCNTIQSLQSLQLLQLLQLLQSLQRQRQRFRFRFRLRSSDLQSDDLDSIHNSCDVYNINVQ